MTLPDEIKLVSPAAGTSLQLAEAVVERPELTLTMDGASSLTLVVADHSRKLVESEAFTTRSWATVAGVNFELVGASKAGDRITLTFEDAIAAALRRDKGTRRWPAKTTTRRGIGIELAKKAGVKYSIDPEKRAKIKDLVERAGGDTSWDLLGTLAGDINWRRFSNGRRLVMGGDEWLLDLDPKPTRIREHTGPFHDVDFDLHVGKRASTCTVTLDAEYGALTPGSVCLIADDYPATDGKWLLQEYRQFLGATTATATLTRKAHTLKEPKGTGAGDPGDNTYVPDRDGDAGGGRASNPAREKMVAFALAQRGDSYSWGGNGPSAWDCSGLVQGATAAAGKTLTKPSRSQWGTCQSAGVTIPVAEALKIRGALLFRIGAGEYDHVAISLGNGSTIEAMGSAYGVLVAGDAGGRGWTGAALWI